MKIPKFYWNTTLTIFALAALMVCIASCDGTSTRARTGTHSSSVDPPEASPPGVHLTSRQNAGFDIYSKQCVICHDTDAEGDGPLHTMFVPEPANLTLIRDAPALLSSIIIKNGIQGTMMPAHKNFSKGDLNNLLAYIKLQPPDTTREYAIPWGLKGKPAPPNMGRDTYITSCAGCHGDKGDGNGPYFANSYTWPKPANFHARNSQVGRNYALIRDGIPGTMMPAQARKLPEVAMWAVAQYVTDMYDSKSSFTIRSGNLNRHINPYKTSDTDIVAKGKQAAGLYCAYCHGGEVDGTLIAPALDTRKWLFGGGTDTALFDVIEQGVPGKLMPPHSPLPENLRWAIITYIRDRGGLPNPLAETLNPPGKERAQVTMRNLSFHPREIIVNPGDEVQWKNEDQTAHTTTSNSWDSKRPQGDQPYQWNSGPLSPGHTFTRKFDKPGVYVYMCHIHPYMMGYVVVKPAK